MSRFFDMDSPIMRFLTRVADLLILNLITLVCCIPIVTIGASVTAMHYVLLKMVRNEEGYIVRAFFKSFRQNWKQATIIWGILFLFLLIFAGDIFIFNYSSIEFPKALKVVLLALSLLIGMIAAYVFPILSRFDNTVGHTFKNALFMAILNLPKTILMLIVYVVPIAVFYFVPMAIPLVFMFGISLPAYIAAMLYNKTFKRFEPEEEPVVDRFETGNIDDLTKNQGDGDER